MHRNTSQVVFNDEYFAFMSVLGFSDKYYAKSKLLRYVLARDGFKFTCATTLAESRFIKSSIMSRLCIGERDVSSPYTYDINSAYPFALTNEYPWGQSIYSFQDLSDSKLGVVEVDIIREPSNLEVTHPLTYQIIKHLASMSTMPSVCYLYLKSVGYQIEMHAGYFYAERGCYMKSAVEKLYTLRKSLPELDAKIKDEFNMFLGSISRKSIHGAPNRASNYEVYSFMVYYNTKYIIDVIEDVGIPWTNIYVDSITFTSALTKHLGTGLGEFKHVKAYL